jgi:hypothetical protein
MKIKIYSSTFFYKTVVLSLQEMVSFFFFIQFTLPFFQISIQRALDLLFSIAALLIGGLIYLGCTRRKGKRECKFYLNPFMLPPLSSAVFRAPNAAKLEQPSTSIDDLSSEASKSRSERAGVKNTRRGRRLLFRADQFKHMGPLRIPADDSWGAVRRFINGLMLSPFPENNSTRANHRRGGGFESAGCAFQDQREEQHRLRHRQWSRDRGGWVVVCVVNCDC